MVARRNAVGRQVPEADNHSLQQFSRSIAWRSLTQYELGHLKIVALSSRAKASLILLTILLGYIPGVLAMFVAIVLPLSALTGIKQDYFIYPIALSHGC
jgi:hypothetical protein